MSASDEDIRRALELALEYDLALRLSAQGDIEVLGPLGVADSKREPARKAPARPAASSQPKDNIAPAVPKVRCLVGEGFQLQKAIRKQDLVPQKRVGWEMGVSQITLWRARHSDLPNFPEPVIVRKKGYWRKSDLPALEDALMYFEGRGVFEQQRQARSKS